MIFKHDIVWILLGSLLLLVAGLLNIFTGDAAIPVASAWSILWGSEGETMAWSYIMEERLLRTLNAAVSGGALAFSGLILQSFFRNPLAGPGVLGVSSGASVGVAAGILASGFVAEWTGLFSQYALGAIGAFAVLLVLIVLNKWIKGVTLLVIGLMISFFASSFVNLLLNLADDAQTRRYVEWGFGSFSTLDTATFWWYAFTLLLVMVLGTVYFSKLLNAWVYGEQQVIASGFSLAKSRLMIVLVLGVLITLVTLQCGPVSFIGIAVPQLVRMLFKSVHHLVLLIASVIGGALVAVLADFTLRNAGLPLPLNAITALFGAPVIIFVIIRSSKKRVEL
jgi:iron complex transport system permease protein